MWLFFCMLAVLFIYTASMVAWVWEAIRKENDNTHHNEKGD